VLIRSNGEGEVLEPFLLLVFINTDITKNTGDANAPPGTINRRSPMNAGIHHFTSPLEVLFLVWDWLAGIRGLVRGFG